MKLQRQRLGLTQEDVGKELGVDRSTVAGWETGRAYPDPDDPQYVPKGGMRRK